MFTVLLNLFTGSICLAVAYFNHQNGHTGWAAALLGLAAVNFGLAALNASI